MTETPKTMNLTDIARHIGVTVPTIYNMLKSGRFDVLPIPGTKPRRWSVEAVNAWVNSKA